MHICQQADPYQQIALPVMDKLSAILRAIPQLAGATNVSPLAGGITNHNYRIDVGKDSFVLRIAGENTAQLGIDRGREHACAAAAAEWGVGAEVVAYLPEQQALVTRFVPGRVLSPEDLSCPEVLTRAATAIARLHSGAAFPGTFSPLSVIDDYVQLAQQKQVALPRRLQEALRSIDELSVAAGADGEMCPCHNDLLSANLIDDGQQIRIIDWEYAGMGNRFFDLGNFAENHELSSGQEQEFLRAYFGREVPHALHRLRAMRKISALRESTWGFAQAGISRLDFDFLQYAEQHLQRFFRVDAC
jgi:thiamine kinase-like enzyme